MHATSLIFNQSYAVVEDWQNASSPGQQAVTPRRLILLSVAKISTKRYLHEIYFKPELLLSRLPLRVVC